MSATNTTTNYNLPIFIGSDKPAWLVDFNGAMNAIDAQMKTNADAIATKSPILTFNDTTEIDFTKSGDIITANLASGVSDKVGRALVTPISAPAAEQLVAINTSGVQENLTVGSGLYASNGTIQAVDLNLSATQYAVSDLVMETSGLSIVSGNISVALNTSKSIGKIYGRLIVNNPTSSTAVAYIRLPIKVNPTGLTDDIVISPAGINMRETAGALSNGLSITTTIRISPDGTLKLASSCANNARSVLYYFPCIYFFEDFGDVS